MTDYTLNSPALSVKITSRGAELQSLKMAAGPELLWQADPAVWGRHAPQLFPTVGRLKNDTYRHEGTDYPLPNHGFAREQEFTCTDRSATHCTLTLKDNEVTRLCYPFAFELLITHTLQDQTLVITYTLRNPADDKELLASLGAHPGFKWPLIEGADRNAHTITFEQDEPAPIRRLESGLLQSQTFPTPVHNRVLALRDTLFVADVVMFDALKSRSLIYTAPGAPKIHINFPGFPHLGIWTKPGAGFVCIEPWQGHASPQTFEGEFRDKPGVVDIAPKTERSWQYSISVEA